jgi:acyl dehydratase
MTSTHAETLTLANIRDFVGKELGVSDWETIDQQRIDRFAECTGDRQWIHVDVERARQESPFGSAIAHGYLVLSLVAPTQLDVFINRSGIKAALNYGIDRVRFISPVKAGSRVRNRIKLIGAEDKGNGRTLLTTENTFEIDAADKPALIAQTLSMVLA